MASLKLLVIPENNITGPLTSSFGENMVNLTQFKAGSNPIGGKPRAQ